MTASALEIARALIRCPSVTPVEGGALSYLERLLGDAGFETHRVTFTAEDTPDVENLYARIGEGGPHLTFAGHTDVVPTGDENLWRFPPFSAEVADGHVTAVEYDEAARRYMVCMHHHGYDVQEEGLHDGFMKVVPVPAAAMADGVYARCYGREWEIVLRLGRMGQD